MLVDWCFGLECAGRGGGDKNDRIYPVALISCFTHSHCRIFCTVGEYSSECLSLHIVLGSPVGA